MMSEPADPSSVPPCPKLPWADEPIDWEALWAKPQIDPSAWVAPGAVVVGRVEIGARSSVWYGSIVRGDGQFIRIGADTNIQDGSILHIDADTPCILGDRVSLGHRALVHASTIEDESLIGMSATVLSRCLIGRGALIAAGAVVMEGTVVPPETIWAGVPARPIGVVTDEHRTRIEHTWRHYVNATVAARARYG